MSWINVQRKDVSDELLILGLTQEVDRMATLVNNLLQFSRRGHRQVSTVDVREEIANSIEFVHYHLRNRSIEVVQEFTAEVPTIQADRQQLRQLFMVVSERHLVCTASGNPRSRPAPIPTFGPATRPARAIAARSR